jgi:uncharacterized protein (TIGR02466 family)
LKAVRDWFSTRIYCERLQATGLQGLNEELAHDCYRIRDHDAAGRRWSSTCYPGGYTSYGSLDRLHEFASSFGNLRRRIDAHAKRFARALEWDLRGGRLGMTDCWLSIMGKGCGHSFHLHPQAVLSGTYYVRTPRDSPPLKFEDPRLASFMAAPPRRSRAREQHLPHIAYPARAGNLILFESWLRHEVPPSPVDEDRISVSFNYHWL